MTNNHIARSAGIVTFGGEVMQLFFDLRWMVALSVVLILADFWFGSKDSKNNGEPFRVSRAGRRTMNKFVDYVCYLLIGGLLGKAIFEPFGVDPVVVAACALGIAICFEVGSIAGHICSLHGIEVDFSMKKFIVAVFKHKSNSLAEAVDKGNHSAKTNILARTQ